VELDLAEYGAEGGLRELGGLVDVVGDFDDSPNGVDDAECDDRVDLESDVVAGDDVLRGNLHRLLAQRDTDDALEGAEDQDDTGADGAAADAAESEEDTPLVLVEDLDAVEQIDEDNDDGDEDGKRHEHLAEPFRQTRRL